jgi:hypothetical protein
VGGGGLGRRLLRKRLEYANAKVGPFLEGSLHSVPSIMICITRRDRDFPHGTLTQSGAAIIAEVVRSGVK